MSKYNIDYVPSTVNATHVPSVFLSIIRLIASYSFQHFLRMELYKLQHKALIRFWTQYDIRDFDD